MSVQTLESSASLAQRTSVAGAASTAATPQTASLDGSSSLIGKRPASRECVCPRSRPCACVADPGLARVSDNLRDDQEGRPTVPGGGPAIREATPQTSGPDAVPRFVPTTPLLD